MAALALSDLITQVRRELLEPATVTPPSSTNDGQWLDSELQQWCQEANDMLTEEAEIESPATTITTVASTESYALPADFLRIRRVEAQDIAQSTLWAPLYNSGIDYRLPNTISGAITGRGRPASYFLYAGLIYLIPIPDAAYQLNVFYYKKGNQLVLSTDLPIIDARFHYVIKEYVTMRAKRKIDDPGFAVYENGWLAGKLAMIQKLGEERHTEGPRVVREV